MNHRRTRPRRKHERIHDSRKSDLFSEVQMAKADAMIAKEKQAIAEYPEHEAALSRSIASLNKVKRQLRENAG